MQDPYKELGVSRDADADTIKKAFKKLARKYHPDVNQEEGAEDRFKRVNAAYDVVGDEKKRKLFDRFGEASLHPGFNAKRAEAYGQGFGGGYRVNPGAGGRRGAPGDYGFGGINLEDLFGGGFAGGGRMRQGESVRASLAIEAMMAFQGGETSLSFTYPNGMPKTLKVRVPAGVTDGQTLKLRGKGMPPPHGGPAGDLLLTIHVPDHPVLRRVGDNLEMDVPITVLEALEGGSVTVPTLTGDVKVKVPKGTTGGKRLRLRGRGVQRRGRPGDLFLVLRPTLPVLEEEEAQAKALEAAKALEELYEGDLRSELKL